MRRDRIANEKYIDFVNCITYTAGITLYSAIFDTMRVSTSQNHRSNLTNLVIAAQIASGWSSSGYLQLTLQHCVDGLAASMVNYARWAMSGGQGEDLYMAEIKDFNRYIRLAILPTTANVTLSALGVGNRSRREPVVQVGTEVAVSYLSNPITY